jgi:Spy/CpxP family protein refolding chaperone
MNRFVTVIFPVVFVLVFSVLLSAEGKEPGGRGTSGEFMMGPKMALGMASELNLSAEQIGKINKIADEMPEKKATMDEIKKDRAAVKEEMNKDNPDKAKITEMKSKINEKYKAVMKNRLRAILAVRAALTEEQWVMLKKKMNEKK